MKINNDRLCSRCVAFDELVGVVQKSNAWKLIPYTCVQTHVYKITTHLLRANLCGTK